MCPRVPGSWNRARRAHIRASQEMPWHQVTHAVGRLPREHLPRGQLPPGMPRRRGFTTAAEGMSSGRGRTPPALKFAHTHMPTPAHTCAQACTSFSLGPTQASQAACFCLLWAPVHASWLFGKVSARWAERGLPSAMPPWGKDVPPFDSPGLERAKDPRDSTQQQRFHPPAREKEKPVRPRETGSSSKTQPVSAQTSPGSPHLLSYSQRPSRSVLAQEQPCNPGQTPPPRSLHQPHSDRPTLRGEPDCPHRRAGETEARSGAVACPGGAVAEPGALPFLPPASTTARQAFPRKSNASQAAEAGRDRAGPGHEALPL